MRVIHKRKLLTGYVLAKRYQYPLDKFKTGWHDKTFSWVNEDQVIFLKNENGKWYSSIRFSGYRVIHNMGSVQYPTGGFSMDNILDPSQKQIENCYAFGWEYIGDGLFYNPQSDRIGYFTKSGFEKESMGNKHEKSET